VCKLILKHSVEALRDDCARIPEVLAAVIFRRRTTGRHVAKDPVRLPVVVVVGGEGGTGRPINRCGNGKKLSEHGHLLRLALGREHVMCDVVFVVLRPIVRSEESLNVT
jgi:hypothetical protein